MSATSYKDLLLKEIISFKQKKTYFNYEYIKKLLKGKNVEIADSTLKSYMFDLTKKKVIFDAGKGWYSSIEKEFQLNKKPVQPLIKKLNKKLPLLSFSCWSTEQLNPFTHHILSKFITFVYTDSDYISNTADILNEAGYTVYENPTKPEISKFFNINKKTVVLLPSISKQPDTNDNYAPIEKIVIDFLMENRNFKIMEETEAEKVTENALTSGRIYISALISYSKRRKFDIVKLINQVQLNK